MKGIILDKKEGRIVEMFDEGPGEESTIDEPIELEPDEVWISENELKFKVREAEIGEEVKNGILIKDSLKKIWYYHLGKPIMLANNTLYRERETLGFDRELNSSEERELEKTLGKEIIEKRDNSELIEKIRTIPGFSAGDKLMSDKRKAFLGRIKERNGAKTKVGDE